MINSLRVKNFRGIKELYMDNIRRFSLISGKNNVGKSTILEAIFLLMDHLSGESFTKLNYFRGIDIAPMNLNGVVEPIFHNMNSDNKILIEITDNKTKCKLEYEKDKNYLPSMTDEIDNNVIRAFRGEAKQSYSVKFHYKKGPYVEQGHYNVSNAGILRNYNTSLENNEVIDTTSTQFINSVISRKNADLLNNIGQIELSGEKGKLIEILKIIDNKIEDIITLSISGITRLYLRVNGELTPIQLAGDGVTNLLSIAVSIMLKKDGLVLIDELETGFHYSTYHKLLQIIDEISTDSSCQVIATTHSLELINSFSQVFEGKEDVSYHRIDSKDGNLKSYCFDSNLLSVALNSNMEVR